jgi:hypothetical protein
VKIDSPYWDLALGVCEKHYLPCVPCPACMCGDGDPDVTFTMDWMDLDIAHSEGIPLTDLVPANFIKPRIIA